jgi:hypothetical protein
MSFKTGVHTFQGGMIKDLDKSLVTNERYLDAHNFRLTTSSGESTGAIENIEGNNNIATTVAPSAALVVGDLYVVVKGIATYRTVPYILGQTFTAITDTTGYTGTGALVINANQISPSGMYVVGNVLVRDWVVLFLTNNTSATPTTGHSMIVKFKITPSTETISDYSVVYDDTANNTAYRLRFSTANPIRAVGMYESSNIIKIYWCDDYNNVRYANIASYLTTDGAAKTGGNYYFPVDLFEFIPETTMSKPELEYMYPGAITAGTVQYAFQYYTQYGSETTMSPLSNTIHVTTDNDYMASSYYYKGEGDITKLTGKSIKMTFSTPDYDRYSHIRIIRLHYQTINSIPSIVIVGEIPISAATTSFLDNGNTSYGILTIDEFNLGETELFSAKDIAVKNGRLFAANINKEEFSIGDWDARAVRFLSPTGDAMLTDSAGAGATIEITNNLANWSAYTDDHDGINPFNDPALDGNATYAYQYQADGVTLGAEGPNIVIGFEQETLGVQVLDQASNSGQVFSAGLETGYSFTSYASPYKSGERSWQRDEVYRLYITFFNAHGIASTAKWICDLRMPSPHNATWGKASNSLFGEVYALPIYPTVTLNSFPTGAVSAQLLRVERGGEDRSVLTQALAIPIDSVSGAYRPQVISANLPSSGVVKLVSPEINILKNITKGSSDYLEYITNYDAPFAAELTEQSTYIDWYKLLMPQTVAYTANVKATIDNTLYVAPKEEVDTFSFNALTCSNYDSVTNGVGSSGLWVHHTNGSWSAEGTPFVIVNYKRDVHASQYGGQTFESREGNIAIPASDVITTAATPYTARSGDTFITIFDVTTQLFDLAQTSTNSLNENVFVALESSINTELRHDRSSSKAALDTNHQLLQETAGKWEDASGSIYDQTTSLYQYNTVYSQDSTAKFYINIPSSVSTETEFDCMVRVSKAKINGESQDSFTLFPINDFIEVGTNKGEVNSIQVINDKLLFWQENAFGILSVNERSLIQDSGGAALVLGTGGVLDRYDYISESIGATAAKHITPSQTGVYWLYTKDRSVYRFTQNLQSVSKSKLIQSWLDEQLSPTQLGYNIIRATYDTRYNQVLMSFYNTDSAEGTTLVFDETIDAFTGFYDFYTYNFIPHQYGLLTTSHLHSADMLFYHNSQLKERCCFYSDIPAGAAVAESTHPTPSFVDSTIKVLFNDNYGIIKVFDDFAFSSTSTVDDVEINNNTFSSIRCYNNYQNTDYCTLTYLTNLERDEREWTTFVPRNAVDSVYTGNPDIFDAGNIDKTRTFKERIRDKYMITDFTYTNTSNRRFVVPYVAVKYRISPR